MYFCLFSIILLKRNKFAPKEVFKLSLGKLIKKFRELRRITQKALGDRIHLDDVRIRQYELDIRTPKDDVLENISAALHINKDYLKEPDYPYTEQDLMRFLFKLDDSIKVNIRPVILNDEEPEYTNTDIYFGSEAILRIRNMLEQRQEMKEKYENNERSLTGLEG